jgi:hypothetical protein
MMDAIEAVFWGGTPCDACEKFRSLWEVPRAVKPARLRRTEDESSMPLVARSSRCPTALALLDMTAEAASQGSTADDFEAVVDLRHGVEPFEDVVGNVSIGLSKVTVRYEESHCHPTGKRYGDDGNIDGVTSIAGGWEFASEPGEVLRRRLMETLARFERAPGEAEPGVTFHATGHTDDLRPVLDGETAKLPGKVKGILGRYFVKSGYPRKGIITLGSASIRWVGKR